MMGLIDYLHKRRIEAREKYKRIIHPDPILADIRKSLKIHTLARGDIGKIILKNTGDIIEEVLRNYRSIDVWSRILTNIIADRVVRPIIESALEPLFGKKLKERKS